MDRAIGVQRRDLTGNCSGRDKKLCLFLFVPLTSFSALLFGGLIGFLWLATVPLTSGTVAQIFGARYLSMLYGIVFFSLVEEFRERCAPTKP